MYQMITQDLKSNLAVSMFPLDWEIRDTVVSQIHSGVEHLEATVCHHLCFATTASFPKSHIFTQRTNQKFFRTRWEDLPVADPVAYLIENLIPLGALTIMVAPSGLGKTEVALQIANCVANGRKFHGRTANKGSVLLLDYEMGSVQVRRYGDRIGLKGYIDVIHDVPLQEMTEIINQAVDDGCKLCIIDSIASLANQMGSEVEINSNHNVEHILKPILNLAHSRGISIIALHHTNKTGQQYDGSQRVKGLADMMLGLSLNKKDKRLELRAEKNRVGFEPLAWDAPDHPLLRTVEKNRETEPQEKELAWVLEQLGLGESTIDELAESYRATFGKSSKTLERVMESGMAASKISKTKVGRRNVYRLVEKLESLI